MNFDPKHTMWASRIVQSHRVWSRALRLCIAQTGQVSVLHTFSIQTGSSSHATVGVGLIQTANLSHTVIEGEARIKELLTEKLEPTYIDVKDISCSGGCGAKYDITIDSEQFKGKRILQQHRMVNEALGEEMKSLHGLTITIGKPELES